MITSTSPAAGLLCRSIVPELVNVVTPIKWPCNGPPSAIALLGLPSGRYCPVLSSVVAPVTAGALSVPLLVKLLFGPVAEVRYGHPERIAHAVPIGVGEVPEVERAIVEDAVIAAGELHEAGDGAVVDDLFVAGERGSPATARSDNAPMLPLLVRVAVPPVELRITPAAGRAEERARADAGKASLPAAHYRSAWRNVDRHVTARARSREPRC